MFLFGVSLVLMPAVVLLLGFDSVSAERQHRTVRYWTIRTRRASYIVGKFLGLWATCGIVALGYAGGLILVLDIETGKIRSTLYDNRGLPGTLRFSADGRRLYSISTTKYAGQTADGAFRVWDTANGDLLTSTNVFGNTEWVTLTPEGFYTGTAEAGRKITVRLGEKETVPEASVAKMLHRPDLVAARLVGESKEKLAAAAAGLAFK